MTVQITPYTTVPSRQSPATFSADRDVRLAEEATRIPQMNDMATEMNASALQVAADAISTAADAATAVSAKNTAVAAAESAVLSPGTMATSTTSLTISVASKTLTVQTGKSFYVGMSVKIAYTSAPDNWMHGDITAYNSGTGELIVNATMINGGGTQTAWTVSLSAPVMPAIIPWPTPLYQTQGGL